MMAMPTPLGAIRTFLPRAYERRYKISIARDQDGHIELRTNKANGCARRRRMDAPGGGECMRQAEANACARLR